MESKDLQREKIRERYRGVSANELEVIPAIPVKNIFDDDAEKRVAVYVRVSSDNLNQTSSFELQKNHYNDTISMHSNWKLVKIYADEGITGTSLEHRASFNEMINDCVEHKIDLIVTKSVSRFARNLMDCVGISRKLASLAPPVGIYFEAESFNTLDPSSEMRLSFLATVAQEDSHNKSDVMNASIEMRFRRGIFLTPSLLGYDKDEDGNLVINEKEASIVRLIFFMYIYGYTCRQIAETLTSMNCLTKNNNSEWSPGSVLQILRNERHCGAVLARKTYTPNYLDHKSRKNRQNRNQYFQKDHHEAIISREDFIAVQHFIDNAKYGGQRLMPELAVIKGGFLYGFVLVHTRWAGFRASDYLKASESVGSEPDLYANNNAVTLQDGDFDFRGYEIARSQFFNTKAKITITFSSKNILFSAECVNRLKGTLFVELLVNPVKQQFAVRSSDNKKSTSLKWARHNNNSIIPKTIGGTAFLPTLYEIAGWNISQRYKIQGTVHQKENESVIIFDIKDAEIIMPSSSALPDDVESLSTSGKDNVVGYPSEWANDFGAGYYTYAQIKELINYMKTGTWNISDDGQPLDDTDKPHVTTPDEAQKNIEELKSKILKDEGNGKSGE